jgi:hypothetical protein
MPCTCSSRIGSSLGMGMVSAYSSKHQCCARTVKRQEYVYSNQPVWILKAKIGLYGCGIMHAADPRSDCMPIVGFIIACQTQTGGNKESEQMLMLQTRLELFARRLTHLDNQDKQAVIVSLRIAHKCPLVSSDMARLLPALGFGA